MEGIDTLNCFVDKVDNKFVAVKTHGLMAESMQKNWNQKLYGNCKATKAILLIGCCVKNYIQLTIY